MIDVDKEQRQIPGCLLVEISQTLGERKILSEKNRKGYLQAAERPRMAFGGSIGLITWLIFSSIGIEADLI